MRSVPRARNKSWLVLLAAALTLMGCGSASTTSEAAESDKFVDGLAAQRGGSSYTAAVHAELHEQVAQCMRAEGFDYQPPPFVEPPADTEGMAWLGDVARDQVSSTGYGVVDSLRDPGPTDGVQRVEVENAPEQSREYLETLYGLFSQGQDGTPGEGGCLGVAEAEMQQQQTPLDVAAMEDFMNFLTGDEEYWAIQYDWADCMARQGFRFESSEDAIGAVIEMVDEAEATQGGASPASQPQLLDDGTFVPASEDWGTLDAEVLDDLLQEELRIALADFDCFEPHRHKLHQLLEDAYAATRLG